VREVVDTDVTGARLVDDPYFGKVGSVNFGDFEIDVPVGLRVWKADE